MMALTGTLLKALPISAAALYLAIGFAVGPGGFGLLDLELRQNDTRKRAPSLLRLPEVLAYRVGTDADCSDGFA